MIEASGTAPRRRPYGVATVSHQGVATGTSLSALVAQAADEFLDQIEELQHDYSGPVHGAIRGGLPSSDWQCPPGSVARQGGKYRESRHGPC